jgi:hypothetical protein
MANQIPRTAAQVGAYSTAEVDALVAGKAPTSPAISLAEIAARHPGMIPATAFDRVAPAAYVRYSATDSTQYSNLVGGGGDEVALTVGQRAVQVNDVMSNATRYAYATRLGGTAGGPVLVELDGRRYWDFRGAESIASGPGWATLDEFTAFALCRPRRNDFDGLFDLGNGAVMMRGGRLNCFNHAPDVLALAGTPGTDVAVVVRLRNSPSMRVEIFLDGVKVGEATDPATSNIYDLNAGAIGSVASVSLFDGLVAEWGVYDSALDDARVMWLSQALRARGTAPDVEPAPLGVNLLVEGNSISDPLAGLAEGNQTGYGPPFPPTQQWPAQLAARHPSWTVTNLAVSSRWTAPIGGDTNGGNVIAPTFAAHLAAYHDPDRANVLVLWEGTNHLCNLSGAGAGVIAAQALLDLGAVAVAAGWKVVIGTITDRDATSTPIGDANYWAEALLANAHLRANGEGTAWHALADLGGDARFQDQEAELYILDSDKVHFTLLGQKVAATEFFGPAIEDAIEA